MKKIVVFMLLIQVLIPYHGARAGFVDESLQSLHEFTLQNGIRVTVKKTDQSPVMSLVCVMKGGKALVPPGRAGLDKLVLQLMLMESGKYTDLQRRTLLKRTSASIGAGDELDFAKYYMKTIDVYFNEVFDLYADLFINPAFPEKFYPEVVTNLKNAYRSDLTDGYARVSRAVNNIFFKGHPYASYLYTPDTLDGLGLDDIIAFHKKYYKTSGMAIFAVGAFDLAVLRQKLNSTFGRLPPAAPSAHSPANPSFSPANVLILDPYADLKKEVAYIRGNFPIVPVTHKDYWPLVLGLQMLSDILSHTIRTQNSMVYSVWAAPYGKRSSYANISAYRTSNPAEVINLVKQSVDMAVEGKCLSPFKGSNNSGSYVSIAEALDFYKTSFFTKFYSGLQDNTSIALKMASSYAISGACRAYLHIMEKIQGVTPGDVQQALQQYVLPSQTTWAVTAHPDIVKALADDHGAYAPVVRKIDLR